MGSSTSGRVAVVAPPGRSRKAGNLAEWRDWQTPILADGPTTTTTRPPTTTTTTTTTSRPPTTTTTTNPIGGCTATFRLVNSWPGGYQGEFVVLNNGSATINGWTAQFTLASGQTLGQLWGGRPTPSGSTISVVNESWNGRLAPSGTATFGFIVNGSTNTAPSGVTCRTS